MLNFENQLQSTSAEKMKRVVYAERKLLLHESTRKMLIYAQENCVP